MPSLEGWKTNRRAPYGARGLKSDVEALKKLGHEVAPRMGRVD